jgi:hypothetical protein
MRTIVPVRGQYDASAARGTTTHIRTHTTFSQGASGVDQTIWGAGVGVAKPDMCVPMCRVRKKKFVIAA